MPEHLLAGTSIFLDANILIYHTLEGRPSCTALLRRVAAGDIQAFTSTHVLGEVLHRLMLAEVAARHHLPSTKAALNYARRHSAPLTHLTVISQFLAEVPRLGIRILPLRWSHVALAGGLSQQHGLLTNDALIVAVMRSHHLTHLATNDADFARVPHLTLWRP